jgi:hypothetical protein
MMPSTNSTRFQAKDVDWPECCQMAEAMEALPSEWGPGAKPASRRSVGRAQEQIDRLDQAAHA